MVMIVAAAVAVLVVIMMIVMLMVVVIVAAAVAILIVVMMVMMLVMVMIVAAAVAVLVVIMMMVMLVVMLDLLHEGIGHGHLLDGGKDGLAVQLVPGGGEDGGIGVLLTEHGNRLLQLLSGQLLSTGEDDGAGGLHLVIIELTEVLHVDMDTGGIAHSHIAVKLHFGNILHGLLHSADDIGQLTHAGRLDEDTVRLELLIHILEGLGEIANQRAANAAGGHLGDLHTGFLQKAAVNADLTEFVLDQHQFLPGIGLSQQFFDQCGLACAEKAGYNIDLCH